MPPTNIPTTNHVFPADLIDTGIGRRNGIGDGITERADAEHAAAMRHHTVTGLLCAGVEDLRCGRPLRVQAWNLVALLIGTGVTPRGQHHAHSGSGIPVG